MNPLADNTYEDEEGVWETKGLFSILVEPSAAYLARRETALADQEQQEWLDSLIPTGDEVRRAENELQTITLLMEVGLL